MKIIATAGKGGTGKTTILAALLSSQQFTAGFRVLVVDADPHQCLTTLLAQAHNLKPAPSLGELRRENDAFLRFGEGAENISRSDLAARLVERALTPLPFGHLLTMGASEQPGCQCVVNGLLGQALDALAGRYDLVVVDNEAGIEPIGRHAWRVDCLLLTATSRPLDMDVALRILDHARAVGRDLCRVVMVLNHFRSDAPSPLTMLNGRLNRDIHLVAALPEASSPPEHDAEWQAAVQRLGYACRSLLEVRCACNGVTFAAS
ncbi:MAG: AAA family ATPase [Chloroflexota bacterium]|jgi:CO dehydrogenase maturation factor